MLALVAVVVIGAIVARPVMHAADELLHIVLVALLVIASTAVAAGAGYLYWRIRRDRAVRAAERPPAVSVRSSAPVAGRPAPVITARRVRRIEPGDRSAAYQVRVRK